MKRGQVGLILPVIFLVIFVVIALALTPTIANQSELAKYGGANSSNPNNMTQGGTAIMGLTPLLYAVVIIISILGALAMFGGRR